VVALRFVFGFVRAAHRILRRHPGCLAQLIRKFGFKVGQRLVDIDFNGACAACLVVIKRTTLHRTFNTLNHVHLRSQSKPPPCLGFAGPTKTCMVHTFSVLVHAKDDSIRRRRRIVRTVEEIAQELDDVQEQLCELYSKRRSLEKEYQSAVLRSVLTNELDPLTIQT
jgi:hypothetical protein